MGKVKVFELRLDSHGVPLSAGKVALILSSVANLF
jgi:hypothetical protein